MGRILDALRQAEASRRRPTEAIGRAYEPPTQPPAEAEPDMPFVEVGGPRPANEPFFLVSPPLKVAPAPSAEPEPEPLPVVFQPVDASPAEMPPAAARFAAELVTFHQPEHAVSEQYRGVLARLAAQFPADRPRIMLYTGAKPGVGTTNVLLNLAITCARQEEARVVVVDTNLRRPAVAQRLALPNVPGLQDVLAGYASLSRAVQETGLENFHVLTAGDDVAGGPIRLAGEAMRSVLRLLGQRFDWIFLDAPCWDGRPDLTAVGAACDAVYLVLPEAEAASTEAATLLKLIPEQGGQLRGCILIATAP